MNHLYIVVRCKTEACDVFHVLMHLGDQGMTPQKVEYWMSYPLMLTCPKCGKTYDYSDSDDEFFSNAVSCARTTKVCYLALPTPIPKPLINTNWVVRGGQGSLHGQRITRTSLECSCGLNPCPPMEYATRLKHGPVVQARPRCR